MPLQYRMKYDDVYQPSEANSNQDCRGSGLSVVYIFPVSVIILFDIIGHKLMINK